MPSKPVRTILPLLAACAWLALCASPAAGQDRADSGGGSLLDRPDVPLVRPEGSSTPEKSGESAPPLPRAGSFLVNLHAKIAPVHGSAWLAAWVLPEPKDPAHRTRLLLPCELLERFESLPADQRDGPMILSGETTVYRGKSFLLLRKLALPPSPVEPAKPVSPPAVEPNQPLVAVRVVADANAPKPRPRGDPNISTAADVLRHLESMRPEEVLVESPTPTPLEQPPAASGAAVQRPALTAKRGEMIVDRLVRILPGKDDGWWQAVFESDNTLQEAPIRLLPCRLLELAENAAAVTHGLGRRYRISGEVTLYKGRRYLLLRKLTIERDMGQF